MDKQQPSNGNLNAGISIRHGPVEEMEVDDERAPTTNGVNGKRKSRGSVGKTYKEATSSDEEEDKPLVRSTLPSLPPLCR
jgi:DNA topoisomerase I